jgi:hypothetical protein
MRKALPLIACATLLCCQYATAEDGLLNKLLRITGISATPSQQKAPSEEIEAGGEIWINNVKAGTLQRLGHENGFRSPIFASNDETVLAVKGEALWRLPLQTGTASKTRQVDGLTKVVGIDREDSDKILVLIKRGSTTAPALLSLATGAITELSYGANSPNDRKLLNHLKGWERVYGDIIVYPKAQTRESVTGTVEWQDVFLKRDDAAPVNVSRCDGAANCGQPSLSGDGTKVVFIRANL